MLESPPEDPMPGLCIHGFEAGQCAACRTCPHGLIATRCGQCLAESATISSATTSAGAAREPEARNGWEIFYAPEVSGWRVRAPEDAALPNSYRSLFLARKAVDQMAANPSAARPAKRAR
jgi:hypothetical protein